LGFVRFGNVQGRHSFAVAQNGDPVAVGHHLVQLMADEDDGFAFVSHVAQDSG
jgi:hypothetical protein